MTQLQSFERLLAGNSIHNPAIPTHFMWLRPVEQRVTVFYENLVIAITNKGLCVIEVGCDVMAPIIYFPQMDICAELRQTNSRTHCPLKGDAAYFDLVGKNGQVIAQEMAWSYVETFDFVSDLKDRVAFNPRVFTIETTPL